MAGSFDAHARRSGSPGRYRSEKKLVGLDLARVASGYSLLRLLFCLWSNQRSTLYEVVLRESSAIWAVSSTRGNHLPGAINSWAPVWAWIVVHPAHDKCTATETGYLAWNLTIHRGRRWTVCGGHLPKHAA